MLAETVDQWVQGWLAEGRAEGRTEGEAKGEARGRAEGEAKSLAKMVRRGILSLPQAHAMLEEAVREGNMDAGMLGLAQEILEREAGGR